MRNISNWFFRLAVLYLVAAALLGIQMGASHDHLTSGVHAHLALLGWVTTGLFAIFYRLWPEAAATGLAKVHFWVYAPAVLITLVALFVLNRGVSAIEPLLGVASSLVGLSVVLFAYIAWKHTGSAANAGERAQAAGGMAAR